MINSQFIPHTAACNLTFDLHGSLQHSIMPKLAVEFGRCGLCCDRRAGGEGVWTGWLPWRCEAIYATDVLCGVMRSCVTALEWRVTVTWPPQFGKVR